MYVFSVITLSEYPSVILKYNMPMINIFLKVAIIKTLTCILILNCFFSCRSKPTAPDNFPVGLQIKAPALFIYAGGSLQLSAIIELGDGTSEDVTTEAVWSTSMGGLGTVDEKGVFKADNSSTGVETVRAEFGGQVATTEIDVTLRATSLAIWPVITTVQAGASIQFDAFGRFHDFSLAFINKKVKWSLSPGVSATIDSNGLLQTFSGATGNETITGEFQTLTIQSEVEIQTTLSLPFEVVRIPAGTFLMGDDNGSAIEQPAHQVFIDEFEIAKYEVTNEQYVTYLNQALKVGELRIFGSSIVKASKGPFASLIYSWIQPGSQFPDKFIEYTGTEFTVVSGFENYPVVRLNWYGAAAFCRFYGLRLPTEAEWEKASRAGQQLEYGTQNGTISHDLANYSGQEGQDIFEGLAPIGSFPPNAFGIYDLSGNVAEYVFDQFDPDYFSVSPSENPKGPGPTMPLGIFPGGLVVWRGGCWFCEDIRCRSAFRGAINTNGDSTFDLDPLSESHVGFRVARSLP